MPPVATHRTRAHRLTMLVPRIEKDGSAKPCALFVAFMSAGAGALAAAEHHATLVMIACLVAFVAGIAALCAWLLWADRPLKPDYDWPDFERKFWAYVASQGGRRGAGRQNRRP